MSRQALLAKTVPLRQSRTMTPYRALDPGIDDFRTELLWILSARPTLRKVRLLRNGELSMSSRSTALRSVHILRTVSEAPVHAAHVLVRLLVPTLCCAPSDDAWKGCSL